VFRKGILNLIVAIFLAACAAAGTPTSSAEPVKFGLAVGLTGYLAQLDGQLTDGAKLAADFINRQGGVLGRRLELVVVDMASDPQQGVQAVQRLITRDGVDVVLGGFSSASTAASAPVVAASRKPMLVASILPSPQPEWVFSTIPPAEFETAVRVDYLKSVGARSVGVLYDTTPYAALQLEIVRGQLSRAGIELVGAEKHGTDATDLRAQLASLLDRKPEALLKFGAGPTNIVAAKGLKQLGATVPLLMSIDDLSTYAQAYAEYPNIMFAAAPPQVYKELERPSKALTDFIDIWTKGGRQGDPVYSGRGWDAVFLAANAVNKAGTTDGEKVRVAFEDMEPYEGTSATYKFTRNNHYGIRENPMVLARFEGNSAKIVYRPR